MTSTLPAQTASDHAPSGTQLMRVAGPNFPGDQSRNNAQAPSAVGDLDSAPVQSSLDTQVDVDCGAPTPPALARVDATSRFDSPVLADPLLALAADVLDDLERVRVANENRLRQLTRDETDSDGEERGFGLTLDHPDVARLASLVEALAQAEREATKNLQRHMRKHPLGPWVKQQRGVGEKQAARLLAAIGDPYWNDLHNRPRTVSELWAYTGYHVIFSAGQKWNDTQASLASGEPTSGRHRPVNAHHANADGTGGDSDQGIVDTHMALVGVAAARARGQRANWSATAKMRAFNIAESIGKQLVKPCHTVTNEDGKYAYAVHVDDCRCSPYRVLYDETRAKYADAVHKVECKRCGPKSKPALPGSPLSARHNEARAYRAVSKALLRDLWREAKRIHELPGGHGLRADQNTTAARET